jgi:outer membrane protein insertion porin family
VPEVDRVNNRVALVLQAEPSRRAYVRRINVVATTARATKWCAASSASSSRRWYDAERIKLSRDRVDRLGYFKEVNVETQEVCLARPTRST